MRFTQSSEHWRHRAEEARTIAELMDTPFARNQMLMIAEGYDRLAEHTAKREKQNAQRN